MCLWACGEGKVVRAIEYHQSLKLTHCFGCQKYSVLLSCPFTRTSKFKVHLIKVGDLFCRVHIWTPRYIICHINQLEGSRSAELRVQDLQAIVVIWNWASHLIATRRGSSVPPALHFRAGPRTPNPHPAVWSWPCKSFPPFLPSIRAGSTDIHCGVFFGWSI
jgi:hypothetical protein